MSYDSLPDSSPLLWPPLPEVEDRMPHVTTTTNRVLVNPTPAATETELLVADIAVVLREIRDAIRNLVPPVGRNETSAE